MVNMFYIFIENEVANKMKCPECGNEVYPDQIVCGYCGAPNPRSYGAVDSAEQSAGSGISVTNDNIDSQETPAQIPGQSNPMAESSTGLGSYVPDPAERKNHKFGKKKAILMAIILLVFCAIGYGTYTYLSNRDTPHIKLLKKYFKAYEDADIDTFLDVLIPKILDKKIKDRDNMPYSEMVRTLFAEMKTNGDHFKFDVKYKMGHKYSAEEVDDMRNKLSEIYGDVEISDLRIVSVTGKRIYKNGTFEHTEPYDADFLVGKYNGEMKIFNYSTNK